MNFRREEEQKQLKVENLRLLKKLQNSNPSYKYEEFEQANKKQKKIMEKI